MRAVVQRVKRASVQVAGQTTGAIDTGLVVLLGVAQSDTHADADYLTKKIVHLRIFADQQGKFADSVQAVGGAILVVSQFTLYGDCRKGRRPSFSHAADGDIARPLYEYFVTQLRQYNIVVETGQFQATMAVQLVNDGPVTLILDSQERGRGE